MPLIAATDWIRGFTTKLDNFTPTTVRGFSSKARYDAAKLPLVGQRLSNPDSTFVKSRYIGLMSSTGQHGRPMAYQLWSKKGTATSTSDGNGYYIRRGGNFAATGGHEYFESFYEKVKNNTNKYELRKIGAIYRNNQEQTEYKTSLASVGVDIALLDQYDFDWASATYDPQWLLQKLGYPANMTLEERAAAGLGAAGINFAILANPSGGSSGGGSGGGSGAGSSGSSVPGSATNPNPVVKIVTRMPIGYAGTATSRSTRPSMVQAYKSDDGLRTLQDEFTFRYVPQGIKYSGLAGEWVEIPRAEDIPFVDWARWQLMKVTFSFIVADDRTEDGGTLVPDGLITSVDAQLEKLRRMAQRKVPVVLSNFDDMLTFQLRRASAINRNSSPNMEFVIQDLSISATRRVTDDITGTPVVPSAIAVAQVDITLTEIPVEVVGIIGLPPIATPGIPPPTTTTRTPVNLQYGLLTDILPGQDRARNLYVP
jgi:hypothetical protein